MTSSDPRITLETTLAAAIVRLTGEIDLSVAPALRDTLTELADGTRDVVVDLTEVSFMDSTGLGALISGRELVREGGRKLVLVGVGGPVRRLFSITKLDQAFDFHPTVVAALAAL